jgi:2-polyprenyl-3-methyl-5-hydroxy-6-metoxy-1,4-benzoquinol methylase
MHASVSFQDFIAASPYTDPVDRKKLLFVYRAVEDLAAERRSSTADFSMLDITDGVSGVRAPLARLGARVHAINSVEDALTFRHDAHYDVIVVSDMIGPVLDPDAGLENVVRHLAPDGLVIVTTPNGYGLHRVTRGKLFALFHRHGLRVHRFMNSGFILTSSKYLRAHPTLGAFDADFANLVPHWMASGWYVTLRKHS